MITSGAGKRPGDPEVMAIFDGVIAIFNEAQPQFIRDCLDRDAQRRYLYDALDSSIKQYLERVAVKAHDAAVHANDAERRQLQADIEDLRRRERRPTGPSRAAEQAAERPAAAARAEPARQGSGKSGGFARGRTRTVSA